MTTQASGTIVDRLWSSALGHILPESRDRSLRPGLGDQVDLFVLQSATTELISLNPGFARVLYTSAYESAERNAYFIIRRLGMPADFFWKFDQWSEDRALKIVRRVVDRVFSELLDQHNAGRLFVESVDVERGRFELSFRGCAECRGTRVSGAVCFFHAGTFAGILGSMLNRTMIAAEIECEGTDGDQGECRFLVGEESDRNISARIAEAQEESSPKLTTGTPPLEQSTIDIGYYQLLLGTVFLPNLDLLETACLEAGREIGRKIAGQIRNDMDGDSAKQVQSLFASMRYMDLKIERHDDDWLVTADGVPESLGALSNAAVVPIFCGELESLLNELGDESIRFESVERVGNSLLVRFIPNI